MTDRNRDIQTETHTRQIDRMMYIPDRPDKQTKWRDRKTDRQDRQDRNRDRHTERQKDRPDRPATSTS